MRRISALLAITTLVLAACGGSDDAADTAVASTDAPAESAAPPETEAPAETDAPPETEAPAETDAPPETEAPADTTVEAPAAPSGAVAVSLVEWMIETPTEIAAGTVTFDVSNGGDFPHHFAIARGNSYEELPQIGGGAIDEDALGDDFLGRTANLQSGEATTIDFDLTPGNYVIFCNIAGTVSHAAQGQTLAVTVS